MLLWVMQRPKIVFLIDYNYKQLPLEQSMMKYCFDVLSIEELKYLACKYGEMQIFHQVPNAVNCLEYPANASKQCEECESILVDCLLNCSSEDVMCSSACNREFIGCTENCTQKIITLLNSLYY